MYYKGYNIQSEYGYFVVTGDGEEWTEDSIPDAKKTIDNLEEEAYEDFM